MKLRGAVIGLGYWGPNLVRNFIKLPGVEIVSGCDLSEKTIRKFSQEYPTIYTTTDVEEIFMDENITFVAIATPLTTHFSLAERALKAGKHVLIEKPITAECWQAESLIRLAKKQQRTLMVGHTFVYSAAVQKIKKIISQNSFGTPIYFDSTRINLGKFQADTNVLWDLLPHDFSILSYLFEMSPISLLAVGTSYYSQNFAETAHVFLRYKNHFSAHIHVSWLSPVKIRRILIGGSKQMVEYDDIQPTEKVRIYNKSVSFSPEEITPFAPAYRSGAIIIPQISQTESLYTELGHFITCIKKQAQPLSGGAQGLQVIKLLEAADTSLRTSSPVLLYGKR